MWLTIAALIGGLAGAHQLYHHVVRPRRRRTRALLACELIEQWFNAVDQTIEHGFDMPRIYNLEDRVSRYLDEANLQLIPMRFSLRFRRRFLKGCVALEFRDDPQLFERYSRVTAEGTTLGVLWADLVRDFHAFRKHYQEKSPETNFANLEMRIRLLRMYFRVPVR